MLIFFHIAHSYHRDITQCMSKGTVTMDTTDATHAHMINLLFRAYRKYHSSSSTRACDTRAICTLTIFPRAAEGMHRVYTV